MGGWNRPARRAAIALLRRAHGAAGTERHALALQSAVATHPARALRRRLRGRRAHRFRRRRAGQAAGAARATGACRRGGRRRRHPPSLPSLPPRRPRTITQGPMPSWSSPRVRPAPSSPSTRRARRRGDRLQTHLTAGEPRGRLRQGALRLRHRKGRGARHAHARPAPPTSDAARDLDSARRRRRHRRRASRQDARRRQAPPASRATSVRVAGSTGSKPCARPST